MFSASSFPIVNTTFYVNTGKNYRNSSVSRNVKLELFGQSKRAIGDSDRSSGAEIVKSPVNHTPDRAPDLIRTRIFLHGFASPGGFGCRHMSIGDRAP